jgi:peptidoglycan/xylan/chitin deacetylase (PgdA/CDA1 family)
MKKTFILVISLLVIYGGGQAQSDTEPAKSKSTPKYMCITFDDLPVVRVHDHFDRMVITDQLLGALAEFDVKAAGFVIGSNIHDHYDLLEQWLAAGHTLGTHTYSHPDLNDVPAKLYIQDIAKGNEAIEDVLVKFKQKKRYFRYPLLHYGDSKAKKKAIADYLDVQELIVAHVSIDNDEFIYNLQYEKLFERSDSSKIAQLGHEYIDHILQAIEDAENMTDELLGRPVNHILLLHANRLNASFLGDLLQAIRDEGYTFISLDKALTDPLYRMEDGYIGHKGLSLPERLIKSNPDFLPAQEKK